MELFQIYTTAKYKYVLVYLQCSGVQIQHSAVYVKGLVPSLAEQCNEVPT